MRLVNKNGVMFSHEINADLYTILPKIRYHVQEKLHINL